MHATRACWLQSLAGATRPGRKKLGDFRWGSRDPGESLLLEAAGEAPPCGEWLVAERLRRLAREGGAMAAASSVGSWALQWSIIRCRFARGLSMETICPIASNMGLATKL